MIDLLIRQIVFITMTGLKFTTNYTDKTSPDGRQSGLCLLNMVQPVSHSCRQIQ
jgi:hypothetical protein